MFCSKCESTHATGREYLKHLRDFHPEDKDLSLECDCGSKYTSIPMFSKHWYKTHHEKKERNETTSENLPAFKTSPSVSDIETVSPTQSSSEESCKKRKRKSTSLCDSSASKSSRTTSESGCDIDSVSPEQTKSEKSCGIRKRKCTISSDLNSKSRRITRSMSLSRASTSSDTDKDTHVSDSEKQTSEDPLNLLYSCGHSAAEADVNASGGSEVDSDVEEEFEAGQTIENQVQEILTAVHPLPTKVKRSSEDTGLDKGAGFLLKIMGGGIPNSQLSEVMSDTQNIVVNALKEFSSEIQESLKKVNVDLSDVMNVDETIQAKSDVFVNVKSETQRKQYFKERLNVVSPVSVPLGAEFQKGRRKGKRTTTKKFENALFVPVDKLMEKLVNHPDYKNFVENKSSSTSNSDILDCYMKGEKWKKNKVLKDHPDALRFILYYDDLEVCSPLKSKANKQKLGAFYIMLDNIPLKHRSNLSIICLVALVNANLIKTSKYGMDCVLEIIVQHLKKFEDGVILGGKKVFGTLIAVIGDNLGIHAVAGFKEGFTATHCCRYCMATLEKVRTMVVEDLKLMRDEDSHDQQCDEVQTVKGKNVKMSTKYGVNRGSALNNLDSFHIVGGCPPDGLHDCWEGWLPLAIKKLLCYQLAKKNPAFTLAWLNAALQDFDYDYAEQSDKPSKIKKEHLESKDATMHQSACQTWLLGTILPLIIGPLISPDDKHYKNFMDCLEISRIVFTVDIPKWMVSYLRDSIENYLTDYQTLYGDLIPKQHYLIHYPSLILEMGSLVNYLCLRCEAKHKYFKNIVNVLCCYKNIPLSLSEKHQFQQASDWLKGLIKANKCGPCNVMDLSKKQLKSIVPFQGTVIETNWLNLGGTLIVPNRCFICVGVEDCLPTFAKVVQVVIHPGLLFVCEKVITKERNVHLGAYEIFLTNELCTYDPRNMLLYSVYHLHRVKASSFIVLKSCSSECVL